MVAYIKNIFLYLKKVLCESSSSTSPLKNGKKNEMGIIPEEENILSYLFDGGRDPGSPSFLSNLLNFNFHFSFFNLQGID